MPNFHVKLGASLLESMTLATVEAFNFRGPRSSQKCGVETYGYIWGSKKAYPDGQIAFFLDKLSVSLTAKRAALSVTPNRRAGRIKEELFKQLAPHQTLLADFHSHPYPSHKAMTQVLGFDFSERDFDDFLDDDFLWESADNTPIMLVQAVCRCQRQGAQMRWQRRNIFHYDVGGYRFWVNAAVGYVDGKGKRQHTGNLTRSVVIEPTPFIGGFSVAKFAS
jgi:hypothetical protein